MKQVVKVPNVGESITEVFIGTWLFQSGDLVQKDEILVDLETQKTSFEVVAEVSGRIEIVHPEPETKVKPGDIIAYIDDSAAAEADSSAPAKPAAAASPPAMAQESSEKIPSPAARKISQEKGVALTAVSGTGKGGRVTKEDVVGFANSLVPAVASVPRVVPATAAPTMEFQVDEARGERLEKASRIRRTIAANLVAAQQNAAILTTFNEVDMSGVMAFRSGHKEGFKKKHGVSLGMVGFFAKAVVRAMKEFPLVNATFTGDSIIRRDFVDLSIAISTEEGLVVPVMRNIEKMTLRDFEKNLAELSGKAREKKLSIPEMAGGTFTISNGGVFGSLLSTPILNMPQSGILGLHKIEKRPIVVDDEIAIRPMMYLALSYDHRIIDGKEAVRFLVQVKEGIENLELIVSDKDL